MGTWWPGPAPAPPSHRAAWSDAVAQGSVPFFHWVSERKQLAQLPAEGMTLRGTSATRKPRVESRVRVSAWLGRWGDRGPSRCPGWRRRVWGRCCSHGATDWAPTLPLKAPTVRQEHRPWTALIQTREASVNRLKRDGRDGPALLGPRLPRTPVPRSPALPLPLTAGLGQQVGCGLWVGGGSVWPW